MMQEEFERLIRHKICNFEYAAVEDVYTNLDSIRSKEHIASIYIRYGMDGIYALWRMVNGTANENTKRMCEKMLSKKEFRLPGGFHPIIMWTDIVTHEIYDATPICLFRHARNEKSWLWIPTVFEGRNFKSNFEWRLQSFLVKTTINHPLMYEPCRFVSNLLRHD